MTPDMWAVALLGLFAVAMAVVYAAAWATDRQLNSAIRADINRRTAYRNARNTR